MEVGGGYEFITCDNNARLGYVANLESRPVDYYTASNGGSFLATNPGPGEIVGPAISGDVQYWVDIVSNEGCNLPERYPVSIRKFNPNDLGSIPNLQVNNPSGFDPNPIFYNVYPFVGIPFPPNISWYARAGIHPNPIGTSTTGWTLLEVPTDNMGELDPPFASSNITYACYVNSNSCGVGGWASGAYRIQIGSGLSFGVISSQETICQSGNPNLISFSILPTSGSTFQWYFRDGLSSIFANEPTSGWTAISGATSSSYDPPAGLNASRTYACRVTNGSNSQWATGVRQVTVLPGFSPGSLIANQFGCAGYNPAPISMATNPQGSGAYNWRWYYAENSTVACLPANPPPTPTWITSNTDTRFFGTSTTGNGITFDPTSSGTSGRTWVLLVTPAANGAIPACGTAQLATTCHRTLINPCRLDVDEEGKAISLSQNIPNPFSDETMIGYYIPEGSGNSQLEVYSLEGKVLFTEPVMEGVSSEVKIQKGKLPSGTFFYRLRTNQNLSNPKKMIIQ